MSKRTLLTTFFLGGAVTAALGGCDVQVHDATPAQYPANYDLGMYEIKATAVPDAMVSPGSVFLFGISGKQRIELTANRAGTEWRGMYAIRCSPSFPLQLLAVWKLQGLATEQKVVPEQPREIKLIEPEPTKEASIDTSGSSKAPKGGWQGTVKYRFSTQKNTQITGAHIEPVSQDAADVAAAKAISVTSPLPVDAQCGVPTEVQLASSAQRAQGNLVIDTTLPAYPHWTTKVVFEPK
jgi:hypothetical protein